jgi:hypothetical protein
VVAEAVAAEAGVVKAVPTEAVITEAVVTEAMVVGVAQSEVEEDGEPCIHPAEGDTMCPCTVFELAEHRLASLTE